MIPSLPLALLLEGGILVGIIVIGIFIGVLILFSRFYRKFNKARQLYETASVALMFRSME